MAVEIVYETHALSEDNECGIATGWLPGRLSVRGRRQAQELGERRRHDGLTAVVTSDLYRSLETANIAFQDSDIPVLADWRLRECDYGRLNGASASLVHGEMRLSHLTTPYPGGESWEQAIFRVISVLPEIALRWSGQRVLLIGHKATGWALRYAIEGIEIVQLLVDDVGMPRGREFTFEHLSPELNRGVAAWHRQERKNSLIPDLPLNFFAEPSAK
jgi:alpha-ribazole phosphatase/probable phosphoglycerate mutase